MTKYIRGEFYVAEKKEKQMSESFMLGALLAFVGGFLDVYTYLSRGHVFANAQTGNMVLFGAGLAEGDLRRAFYYFVPISAFAIGVVIAEFIKVHFKEKQQIHWRQIIIVLEIVILLLASFIPIGKWDVIVNTMVSFVCSLQVQSFRKIRGSVFATTMCTGNLRTATESLCAYRRTKNEKLAKKSLTYYGIICCFISGGVIGATATNIMHGRAVGICCIILLIVFVLMFYKENIVENKH